MYSSLLDRDVKHILIQFTTQHVGNVDVFESVTAIDRSIDRPSDIKLIKVALRQEKKVFIRHVCFTLMFQVSCVVCK